MTFARSMTAAALMLTLFGGCRATDDAVTPSDVTAPTESATPLTSIAYGPIPAGRYAFQFEGAIGPLAEVDVPSRFAMYHDSVLWADDERTDRGLMFWKVTGVNPRPCGDASPVYTDPGPSLEDLATALARQPHRQADPPVPVTFAGYDGLYLRMTFPPRFDPHSCATGSYEAWEANGESRYQYGRRFVDRLWILNVEGERLVVNETHDQRITASETAAMEKMLKSVRIQAADQIG